MSQVLRIPSKVEIPRDRALKVKLLIDLQLPLEPQGKQ